MAESPRRLHTPFAQLDWADIRRQAQALGTDGCSGPTLPVFVDCCYQHDIAYRTHADEFGDPITRREADARMRECIQWRDIFGEASVVAQVRYWALRAFGWWAWRQRRPATDLKRALYAQLDAYHAAQLAIQHERRDEIPEEAPQPRPEAVD